MMKFAGAGLALMSSLEHVPRIPAEAAHVADEPIPVIRGVPRTGVTGAFKRFSRANLQLRSALQRFSVASRKLRSGKRRLIEYTTTVASPEAA